MNFSERFDRVRDWYHYRVGEQLRDWAYWIQGKVGPRLQVWWYPDEAGLLKHAQQLVEAYDHWVRAHQDAAPHGFLAEGEDPAIGDLRLRVETGKPADSYLLAIRYGSARAEVQKYNSLVELVLEWTRGLDEHPMIAPGKLWEGPCQCDECLSLGAENPHA